jgi:pimeloyl-ACP methyl ester carboxylesterase
VAAGLVVAVIALLFAAHAWRATWLPGAIARAPNAGRTVAQLGSDPPPATQVADVTARELRVEVGPPAASIALWILERRAAQPRGTVLLLHGIRDTKRSLLGVAEALAEAGFRAVLVDLRGHGHSTGDWLSYGPREGADLQQVLDALAQRGELALPVGAYGASYGGAAALQLAQRDPRVRAVVTVATFTRMNEIVPLYASRLLPAWFVSRADVEAALVRAGELGEFRPEEADSVAAIGRTSAAVLLLHGRADDNVPVEHSEALHAAAPSHSRLLRIDGRDHRTIMADETVAHESLAWLTDHLVAAPPAPVP